MVLSVMRAIRRNVAGDAVIDCSRIIRCTGNNEAAKVRASASCETSSQKQEHVAKLPGNVFLFSRK